MLFLFSCSEDATLLSGNDGLVDNTKVGELMDAELAEYEDQLSTRINDVAAENASKSSLDPCVLICNREYEACYNKAVRFRDSDFRACKMTLGVQFETRDIICFRTVGTGGFETTINSEGEEVIVQTFVTEPFVCGTEEVEIFPTDSSPTELETYRQCRLDAMEYFLEEQERCIPKRDKCLKPCKEGGSTGVGTEY